MQLPHIIQDVFKRTSISLRTVGLSSALAQAYDTLSMLVQSGMDIAQAVSIAREEAEQKRMQTILCEVEKGVAAGRPLWSAGKDAGLFRGYALSLVRIGEESGKLSSNLDVIATEEHKRQEFSSKIRAALAYPTFVFIVTIAVGVGIAWFVLPRLTSVFSQLDVELPFITQLLLDGAAFMQAYGTIAVPSAVVVLVAIAIMLFVLPVTKKYGQRLLVSIPGINTLIQQSEVAQFGFLFGTLLQAGVPIVETINSMASASSYEPYRRMYAQMSSLVADGHSLKRAFMIMDSSADLIPVSVQRMIAVSEQSGDLPETLLQIGERYERKIDATARNLTTMLEPVLLVVVWFGVLFVALAVLMPIYQLVGDFNAGGSL